MPKNGRKTKQTQFESRFTAPDADASLNSPLRRHEQLSRDGKATHFGALDRTKTIHNASTAGNVFLSSLPSPVLTCQQPRDRQVPLDGQVNLCWPTSSRLGRANQSSGLTGPRMQTHRAILVVSWSSGCRCIGDLLPEFARAWTGRFDAHYGFVAGSCSCTAPTQDSSSILHCIDFDIAAHCCSLQQDC